MSGDTSASKADEYEGVTCIACTRVHFVHKITGELLSKTGGRLSDENILPSVASGLDISQKGDQGDHVRCGDCEWSTLSYKLFSYLSRLAESSWP